MFVACGIWCFADVSSVSPSSEQIGGLTVVFCPGRLLLEPLPEHRLS